MILYVVSVTDGGGVDRNGNGGLIIMQIDSYRQSINPSLKLQMGFTKTRGRLIITQIHSYRQSINPSLKLITDRGARNNEGGLIITPYCYD